MIIDENRSNHNEDKTLSVTPEKPWVILRHGTTEQWITYGPYSSEEVKAGLRTGEFKPTDYCWLSHWTDWKRIYLEPEFYLARKPPIEIKTQKIENKLEAEDALTEKVNELAHHTSPNQYKGWKYKKNKKSDLVPTQDFNIEAQVSKDGERNMLEPWEDKNLKNLDFIEEKNIPPQSGVHKQEVAPATPENYVPEDFDLIKEPSVEKKNKTWSKGLKYILILCMAAVFGLASYRVYTLFSEQNAINYNMSYFVIEDYTSELPHYMYARTDLKKGEGIKIRLFDMSDKQIKTKNAKAGLVLTSQGNGRMRLPMYAYNLEPARYKLVIEVEGQEIEKEFSFLPED